MNIFERRIDPGLVRVLVAVAAMAICGFYSVTVATNLALHGMPLG